ncbi:MAG: hypothetical protein IKD09_07920 [Lentisphaeria bacterium]|nr:hypothetical protein [Lentisphaeria bacterium]
MVRDLFFLYLRSEKSAVFEHKRRVPGKGKTENFGCFMAFPCSLNSPNRELKTKKASRFDWRRLSKNVPIGTLHIGSEADDASYCGTIVKQCFI